MSQRINLKELERKAFRSTFQDGLWDIYLGFVLLAMAVGAGLSDIGISEGWHYGVYGGLVGLSVVVLWAGKRLITVPRIGRVKFGAKRRARLNKVRVVLLASVLAGVALFVGVLVTRGELLDGLNLALLLPAVWVVTCLVVFGLAAYFLEFNRLYLIGVMYALAVPLDIGLDELAGVDATFAAFGVPAAVILLVGTVVLVRFLRDHPLPAQDSPSEGAFDGGH